MPLDRSQIPEQGDDPPFRFPTIVRHRLPNGVEVVTAEHRSVPVVSFAVKIEGGLGLDPPGRAGLASLTADMLDEGIGDLSAIEVSEALARIGAEYTTEVAADATVLTLTTLRRFASQGSTLLSQLVTSPSLNETDFERVRQLRIDRLRQLKDVPSSVADRVYLRQLYAQHPYGHPGIGDEPGLRSLKPADVVDFHHATCRPSQTTVVAVGAMSHDELLRTVSQAFGEWSPATGSPRPPVPSLDRAPALETRLVIVPREGAAQSELRIGHLAARRDTPDYVPLVVMNAVLGGQFVSRINLKLREEKGFTYGARTGFDWHRHLSPFGLQVSVHTAATAEAIADAFREFSELRGSRPPTDDEMLLARASLTRGFPRNFESAGQVANAAVQIVLFGLADTYFDEFVPKVRAVTTADVTRVAREYVDPSRMVVVIVGDEPAIRASLAGLGLGEPVLLGPGGDCPL